MILTGHAIRDAISSGDIEIDPFDPAQINPSSYDLRLGDGVAVYDVWVDSSREMLCPKDGSLLRQRAWCDDVAGSAILDSKTKPAVSMFKIGPAGWVLFPGIGYLMHTHERVRSTAFNPVIDGKSSGGRLFISIHRTAGYGEPWFDGQYTLEVTVKHPVRVYAHMRIAQIRFHVLSGAVMPYHGNYVGEWATGPVASRVWRQFEDDEAACRPST
jgi:dCTP deaminase